MTVQQSIFDETFHEYQHTRRRSLLNLMLKIYIWTLMVIGAFVCIGVSMISGNIFKQFPDLTRRNAGLSDYQLASLVILQFVTMFLLGAMLFLPPLLVWLERKLAVRFNWLAVGFWILIAILNIVFRGREGLISLIPVMILVPYWIRLFMIQREWEQNAISGKQLKR